MKIFILDKEGKKIKELDSSIFSSRIREDIIYKYLESMKTSQPYSNSPLAGDQYSASGILRHRRHKWKTTYGHGISRVPRKILWRRGDQFYWVGATTSGTRGGRKAHAPKIFKRLRKVNKKEAKLALLSCLSSTANKDYLLKRYSSLNKIDVALPIVFDSSILKLKTKEFFSLLEKTLGNLNSIALKEKRIRQGIGTRRNRRYKENAGLLMIIGKQENFKINKIDVVKSNELTPSRIQIGRLVLYTEKALEELNQFLK